MRVVRPTRTRRAWSGSTPALALALVCASCRSTGASTGGPEGVWLGGDLHLHSAHSNDAQDSPVDLLVAQAESLGFDYFVVTDHDNHVDGMLTTWDDPAYQSDSMLMLYGVEWTTALGHANFFGAAPFDHGPLWALRDEVDGQAVADAAHLQDLHFSANHPVGSDPWEHGFDIGLDGIEVWNALFTVPNDNDGAIELWDDLLLEGRRITARGGSDSHHLEGVEASLFHMGNPTTWVFARERTAEAVVEALTAGHVSIGYAPTAERIDLTADADGDGGFETIVGDVVPATGAPLALRIEIVGFRAGETYEVTVIEDGETLSMIELDVPTVILEATPPAGERTYYRVEVRGETPDAPPLGSILFGGFVGMTNPIYVGFD